jgi:hypothetical protein
MVDPPDCQGRIDEHNPSFAYFAVHPKEDDSTQSQTCDVLLSTWTHSHAFGVNQPPKKPDETYPDDEPPPRS